MIKLEGKIVKASNQGLKGRLSSQQIHGKLKPAPAETETFILVTEDGQEIPAVLVQELTTFNATEDDIRKGTTAATNSGVTVGTKVIPTYHTTEGYRVIPSGSDFTIPFKNDLFNFTKLQVVICPWAGSIEQSVAAEKVCLDGYVYNVGSNVSLSEVLKDVVNQAIDLGITNESESLYLVRYFTYKEVT